MKYAYSPGTPILNKTGQVLNKPDSCDIHLYLENREAEEAKRIATGWFRSGEESIVQFTTVVDLANGAPGSNVRDYQKPANGLYGASSDKVTHLTVVFFSGYNGAFLERETNSALVVDDFELMY